MADLYNRIHRTGAEFAEAADRIAALDPADRGAVMAAFDVHWARLRMTFGGVETFRLADRSRRTRFLLDLIGAEEADHRAGRVLDASGAALLTLFLRGVKYGTRDEAERMWLRVERLRDVAIGPIPGLTGISTVVASTVR